VGHLSSYVRDLLDGVITGSVFAVLAMGVVVIYRTTRTVNLAQGGMATLGAFTYIALRERSVPTVVAIAAVLALGLVIGSGIGQFVAWPLRRATPTVKMVATLGLLLVMQSVISILFGNALRDAPVLITSASVSILGVRLAADGLVVLAIAGVSALLIGRLFQSTRVGLYMRAVAVDPEAAALQGVNVRLVIIGSWSLGAALALGAGILLGPVIQVVAPFLLTLIALQALGATLVGRLESLTGALIGGLVLGEVLAFTQEFLPGLEGGGDVAILVFVLVVLLTQRQSALLMERA
jgi:branched-chain amino acid transport system permease protein